MASLLTPSHLSGTAQHGICDAPGWSRLSTWCDNKGSPRNNPNKYPRLTSASVRSVNLLMPIFHVAGLRLCSMILAKFCKGEKEKSRCMREREHGREKGDKRGRKEAAVRRGWALYLVCGQDIRQETLGDGRKLNRRKEERNQKFNRLAQPVQTHLITQFQM